MGGVLGQLKNAIGGAFGTALGTAMGGLRSLRAPFSQEFPATEKMKEFQPSEIEGVISQPGRQVLGYAGARDMFYGGEMPTHGQVAIKMAARGNREQMKELIKEISILDKMNHPNIVKPVGFCNKKKCVVYPLFERGSLDDHLHKAQTGVFPELGWNTRMDIATGIAEGLSYLHVKSIVHLDVKPGNILLDNNFRPILANFGFAEELPASGELSLAVRRGTEGYNPPGELIISRALDIYSFGVVLFELITGQPAVDESRGVENRLLTAWAIQALRFVRSGQVRSIDSRLNGRYNLAGVGAAYDIAVGCTTTREERWELPRIMHELKKVTENLRFEERED